jgi:hypothetical protein
VLIAQLRARRYQWVGDVSFEQRAWVFCDVDFERRPASEVLDMGSLRCGGCYAACPPGDEDRSFLLFRPRDGADFIALCSRCDAPASRAYLRTFGGERAWRLSEIEPTAPMTYLDFWVELTGNLQAYLRAVPTTRAWRVG